MFYCFFLTKSSKSVFALKALPGIFLVVQWLRFCIPNAGGPGSVPGQRTRSHMLQPRPRAAKKTTTNSNVLNLQKLPSSTLVWCHIWALTVLCAFSFSPWFRIISARVYLPHQRGCPWK